ncbi:MAG: TolC family protein [Candidatus Limimorpha sp.]
MKKYLLILIVLLGGELFAQAAGDDGRNVADTVVFTLDDCLRYAVSNNYERRSMELSCKSQELSLEQTKKQRLPSVSMSVSEGYSHNSDGGGASGNAGINASMPLYNGGEINVSIEQESLRTEQSVLELTRFDDNLSINILQAFLSVLGNQELLKYQKSVLKSSREAMRQGEKKYETGSIVESDYLLLVAQYASDTNNVVDTQISIDNSILNLKVLLSMDPEINLAIAYPDTSAISEMAVLPSMNEAIERSLAYSPDLQISGYDIEIAQKSLKIARSGQLPSLNLSAGLNTGHDGFQDFGKQLGDRFSQNVGVSLNIPIYSRGANRIKVKQSELSLQQTQFEYERNILTLRQTVAQEYQNVVSAYNSFLVSTQSKDAYLKSFEAYNARFIYGSITAVELLQQQNNYLNALNKYIQAKYSFILERKILDVYMGNGVTM